MEPGTIILAPNTWARLEAARAASRLNLGEPYFLADMNALAFGTGRDSYTFIGSDRVLSVKDLGAVGDGAADDTTALQAAFDYGIANNVALYVPAGVYNYSAIPLDFSGASASRGLRIHGDTSGNLFGGRGSVLKCTGTGTGFTIDGNAGQAFLRVDGVTFEGNSNLDYGVYVDNASYLYFDNCVFYNHQKSGAIALYLFATNPGGFTGLVYLNKCGFENNTNGVRCVGDQVNVGAYSQCAFLDHTGVAIQFGDATSLMQSRLQNITGCTFEGNARDIKSLCRNMSLNIHGNYFENNEDTHNTRIEIEYNGVSPTAESVVIEGNFFQKELANAGESVIYSRSPSIRVTDNYFVGGADTDRYFVTAIGASQYAKIDVPAPGSSVYINRHSVGAVGTALTYTGNIDTGLRPQALAGGANVGVIYQGAGVPSNSLGADGDIYINTDTYSLIAKRDALWQKGASFWNRITFQDTVELVTYSASMTLDLRASSMFVITPTNSTAFTINAISNAQPGQVFTVSIVNTTGGALGAITFNSGTFKIEGSSFTAPADGNRRSITFVYEPNNARAYEISRNAADVPN